MSRRACRWLTAGAVLAVLVISLTWSAGLRFFVVVTPSMGVTAPVGTLVMSQRRSEYRVDEVISFVRNQRVYTHRIVAIDPDGALRTKGDLNAAPDAVPVRLGDVIGAVVWSAPGLGWAVRAAPWLVVGSALVYGLAGIGRTPAPWRWAVVINGCSIVACLVTAWLRPWVNLEMLAYTAGTGEGVLMHLVNTGLLPVEANGTLLVSGADAVVSVTQRNAAGLYSLTPSPHLEGPLQVLLPLLCLIPLVAGLFVPGDEGRPRPRPRRAVCVLRSRAHPLVVLGIVLVLIACAVIINTAPSLGAYTARATNATNTAGSRTFFTCRNATTSLGSGSTFVAFALDASGSSATDLSGNGRNGTYSSAAATSTSRGCVRDSPAVSVTFNGSKCLYLANSTSVTNPSVFSLEAWFRTSTRSNGRIIGFGNVRNTVADTSYDRHLYLDRDGRVVFGVYANALRLVYTPAGTNYADGQWHHVVATLSPAGQKLYVDGTLAMTAATVTSGESYTGWWKFGCGKLTNWQNAATAASGSTTADYNGPSYFTGQLQYASVRTTALSAARVLEHYRAGLP